MNTFFSFVMAAFQNFLVFAHITSAPPKNLVNNPTPTAITVTASPSVSPTVNATTTVQATPKPAQVTPRIYSDFEILKIHLEYSHEQCLADQIPLDPDGTGTTQYNALVASDNKLIRVYGIDKGYLGDRSRGWYKTNREYYEKIAKANRAPCPIVTP